MYFGAYNGCEAKPCCESCCELQVALLKWIFVLHQWVTLIFQQFTWCYVCFYFWARLSKTLTDRKVLRDREKSEIKLGAAVAG